MFRLRTALATLVLFTGLGPAGHAQMQLGAVGGLGLQGYPGGFGSFPQGFVGGINPFLSPVAPYGYGYGYGFGYSPAYDPPYGYYPPPPQTYNGLDSLMGSIQRSTSRRRGGR